MVLVLPKRFSVFNRKQTNIFTSMDLTMGFPGDSVVKNPPANAGDTGLISGLGRSPREGNGNPLQYSFLGNPMDRGAWQAMVHRVAKSQRQLKWVMMDIWSISFKRVALIFSLLEYGLGEFPGGPVVRILHFHCRGLGFDPCWGTKIPKAMWRGLKKRKD